MLDDFVEKDFGTWNGLYWRTNRWFVDWFRARMPKDDRFPFDDFAEDDFVRFILKVYPSRAIATWGPADLPHLLHELRAEGKRLEDLRQRPQD